MECNKDEAIRAREIAERKMQNSDFSGAKRFALKAQQLYANLDNISMILAVCEVHCSAQNKMIGSDVNWYDVLQIEKMADETIIKKQYRKLALLLHPDKNKFAGAEAAFKLIGEANRVLSNKMTRSAFDLKVRAFMKTSILKSKPPFHPSSGSSFVKKQQNMQDSINKSVNPQPMANGPRQKSHGFQHGSDTIWTRCPHCNTSFEYHKIVLGRQICCPTCRTSFSICETEAPVNYRSDINLRQPKCFSSKGNSGSFHMGSEAAGRATKNNGGSDGDSVRNSVPAPPTKAGFPVSDSKRKGSDVDGVSLDAQKKGPKSDVRKPVEAKASRSRSKKRGRPGVVESSKSSDEVGDADVETEVKQEKGYSKLENDFDARRHSRPKKSVSYTESLYDGGECAKSPKMPETVHSDNNNSNEAHIDKGLEDDDGNAFATTMNGIKTDAKQYNGTSHEEILSNKKRKLKKQSASSLVEDEVDQFEQKNPDIEPGTSPISYDCPDLEFSDFDKDKENNCFDVDQIWAVYDTVDAMPRFYARVKKVLVTNFKLRITWLEPDTDGASYTKWTDEGLPTACGTFKYGTTEDTTDHLMFSHQMCYEFGKNRFSFVIYPRAGEIWALFRNWDISWANDPEKHKPYKFEFVVILSDFDQKEGVKVAYIKKLRGFVSLFQRITQDRESSFHVPPGNLFQFSHRIPSFQMSGTERDDVPEGSYELDTASLPNDIDELVDFTYGEVGNEMKKMTGDIACKQSTETNITNKKHCLDNANLDLPDVKRSKAFPKEAQSHHESGTAASNQGNDHIIITPRNPTAVVRRSPRGFLSKKGNNPNVT